MRGGWVENGTVLIRLTRQHFAFYRGYLDGLDIGELAERYLENAPHTDSATEDLRLARRAVAWIRGQLVLAARRSPNPSSGRLLALPPEKLSITYASSTPSLEQFREERDPDGDFYTEEALIALFEEEYGSDAAARRRAVRNHRLRTKQLIALTQLESLAAADPKMDDGVDGWLDPAIAKRLTAADVKTIGELVAGIDRYGYRWYKKIPRIGEIAAKQVVRWLSLASVQHALNVTLSPASLTPRSELTLARPATSAARTDVVALENFHLPHELNGSQGSNRGQKSLLSARNDLEAIHAWLRSVKPGSHTQRSYRKEAERFLLWSVLEKGKPISSLTVEDCTDYRDFLFLLGSMSDIAWNQRFKIGQDKWIGSGYAERWSAHWRPFKGRLSPASQKQALITVQNLLEWLTKQHYLHGNPLQAVSKLGSSDHPIIDTSRALTVKEWKLVKVHLSGMANNARYTRLRLILVLAYGTGLRLSELVSLRRENFRIFNRDDDTGEQWQIQLTGKGNRRRDVEVGLPLMNEIRHYFRTRGHDSFESAGGTIPLIAALPPVMSQEKAVGVNCPAPSLDDPLTVRRLHEILKQFFQEAAAAQPTREQAQRLEKASTHWLRHTFATHALQSGVSLEVVRDLLGHRSLSTTSVYINAERDRRSKELERFNQTLML